MHAVKKKDCPKFGTILTGDPTSIENMSHDAFATVSKDPTQYQNIVHAIKVKLIRNQVVREKLLKIEAHLGTLAAFGTAIHSRSSEFGLVNSIWSK
ncbi:hypothetical protein MTP99_000537 [Tenebrio molitor]|nr:hypothetical protein MTP99_000537 [Tenebrio molitor]